VTIRILIVDDHLIVREGLRLLLSTDPELDVVGEAATGTEAVHLARLLRPDVVLMDLLMPELNGVAATAAIKSDLPQTEVFVLTGLDEDRGVAAAVRAGAIGYLHKDVDIDCLRQAIKAAVAGRIQLTAKATRLLVREVRTPDREAGLTGRETEVLMLLAQGLANKEIARALGVRETTVKSHVRHILTKLGAESRTQAALTASHQGLLTNLTN
jgi:DNA-binding NarL/FixJ family response regulator